MPPFVFRGRSTAVSSAKPYNHRAIGCRSCCWVLALCLVVAPVCAENEAADDAGAPTPTAAPAPGINETSKPAPGRISIQEAVEGLSDLDEPTRQGSLERLRTADEADIPALEKFAKSNDPEVRQTVSLVLKKLKRGELAFVITYPDGKPIPNAAVTLRVFNADEVKVYDAGFGQPIRVMYNPPRQGFATEDERIEVTSDAEGRVTGGRMNDGKYLVLIDAPDSMPRQTTQQTIALRESTQPGKIIFKRGVNLTVSVVDEDGNPVKDATVLNIEQSNMVNTMKQLSPSQIHGYLRMMSSAVSDEKGVAVIENTGLTAVQPAVFCVGYEAFIADKMEAEDGGEVKTTIKVVKVKPVEFTIQLRSLQSNKSIGGARAILVPAAKLAQIVGANWYQAIGSEHIDEYLEAGAIDLGTAADNGELKFSAIPEAYFMFAFKDKEAGFMQIVLNRQNPKQNVRMQPIQRR